MKFKNIQQFTQIGSYQINTPLKYLMSWLQENITEQNLILNPDFQRGNVWNEDQQIKFMEYLFKGGKSGRLLYFNCPSWRTQVEAGEYDDFVCVDGLQRITAIMKFMNNELKVFGCLFNEYEDKIPMDADMLVNVNNLQARKEVLQWYLEMNSGGTVHTEEELERVRSLLNTEDNFDDAEYKHYCLICGEGFDYDPRDDVMFCEECYCPKCDKLMFENCECEWDD